MPASRRALMMAVTLLIVAAGTAAAEEICLGPGGLEFIFHLTTGTVPTSVGSVATLTGLVRSNAGGVVTRDPVTGTALLEDATHVRIHLHRAALGGDTTYSARLTSVPGFVDGFFWVGTATVNRVPQGTTLFPQTTIQLDIVECATGEIRKF